MISTLEEKPHIPAAPRKRKVPGWAVAMLGVAGAIALLSITSYQTNFPQLTSSGTTQTAVRLALPILLAGLGGLWAERAGVVNIGLEGMMIMGTWGAAWAGYQWGPWAALVAAVVFGSLGGLLHAIATVTFGVNHIVSGVAINLLGAGLTKYLSTLIFLPLSNNPRQSPPVQSFDTFSAAGLGDWLGELEADQRLFISDVAGILRGLVTGVSPLTMIAILLLPLSYWLLWRTRFGLRLRSVGENPHAADSLGVKVYFHKYVAVIVSGGLAGLGGAALVLNPGQLSYLEGQTGGRGYIGLAAMIFGNWRPGGLLGGAALFGYADGLQLRSGGETVLALVYGVVLLLGVIVVWQLIRRKWFSAAAAIAVAVLMYLLYISLDEIPSEFVSYAPHMVTLAVLAVASQRLRMPAADGLVYRRG
ncbi:ABC transporter permease [Lentzea flaviverrucosa]|uniref:Simple sugar transport system permease protein n=1 Tax=Lentzea flaviverrucosa TaxID=200379 RepID=A0A1H9TRU5_9PSEU|nr:ABC transporter permease [Lentzea flaviverrucosa]RDI33491.1 nucleoside ABC transporter membrane protein [Lentzea flaviverrucosa]SES00030.1 simple sugar transport system permease protein [Lentzea flaviverrucosa]